MILLLGHNCPFRNPQKAKSEALISNDKKEQNRPPFTTAPFRHKANPTLKSVRIISVVIQKQPIKKSEEQQSG